MTVLGSLEKIAQFGDGHHLNASAVTAAMASLLVLWAYVRGIRGAFRYHYLMRNRTSSGEPSLALSEQHGGV